MRILTKKSTAAVAGLIATVGMLSACSSSDTSTSESVSSEIATVEQGASTSAVPADVAQAFFVAYCNKQQGTLNEATGECTTADGSTSKIDVTQTNPESAAIVVGLAYEDANQVDIPGCPTAAEFKAAASGDTPPSITLDCQIAAIEAMTAALSA
ncbi:unannotated protein [freshwater metagenome]|uniref:Unannotated protein n=1 Tax=freshwater metagenome TaxID=449393 RepID=A0A6J7HBT7_9ZZZZ|nr:hypothetical protein [Actinomycetota bacterium]